MKDKLMTKLKEWGWLFLILFPVSVINYSLLIFGQAFNDSDGTWHGAVSYAGGWELGEGRWFWPFLDKAKGYLSPDPLASVTALFLFALGFILVLDLMKVKSRSAALLSGLVFMTATPVCCSLSYRYMSHVFAFAFLLASLAAYVAFMDVKPWLAAALSAVCIAFSMGLYQADLGATALIMLIMLILMLYSGEEVKRVLIKGGQCLISILAGGLLYYLMWQEELIRHDTEASSYGGADSVSISGIFLHLPETLFRTVRKFISYFGNHEVKISLLPRWIYIIIMVIFAGASVWAFYKMIKRNRAQGIVFLIFTVLIPLFPMCTYMLTYNVSYMSGQMTAPLALCLSLMICLIWIYTEEVAGALSQGFGEYSGGDDGEGAKARDTGSERASGLKRGARIAAVLACLFIMYGQHLMNQYDMYAMSMGRKSVETIADNVIDELITEGLYAPGITYCFIGSPSDSPLYYKNLIFEECNNYARYGDWGHVPSDNSKGWQGFFTHVKGINLKIAYDSDIEEIEDDPAIAAMPVFPAKGSIALMHDMVVIRLVE